MLKKNRRFGSVGPPNVFASKEISRVLPNVPLISEHFLRRIHSSSRNRFHQGHRTEYSAPDNMMPGERGVDDDEGDVNGDDDGDNDGDDDDVDDGARLVTGGLRH